MKILKLGFLSLACFVFSISSFSQPTANGNVMNFSNVATYEPYADDESTWSSLRSIAQQSSTLTTLYEARINETDTLYPEFLYDVLNTDYIFQIGSYLIKIDLKNDRGLVINEDVANAYSSLVNNNLFANGIMVLDGDDDFGLEFLEALEDKIINESNYEEYLNQERICRGAQRKKKSDGFVWGYAPAPSCEAQIRQYVQDNKLVYQKAIFYFSLQSKIKSKSECLGGSGGVQMENEVDLKLQGTVRYRKRCGPESNLTADLEEGYFGGNQDGELYWRPYSGGRSLSHYDFTARFGIRNATDRTPNPPPYVFSPYYNIKSGY